MLEKIIQRIAHINRRKLIIYCAVSLLLLGYIVFREGGIWGTWCLSRTQARIESDNRRLREENALMKRDVEDLKSNRSRIEMEAHKLGYVYPDEFAVYWKRDNGTTGRMFIRPANSGSPSLMVDR